jgi:hypothetical protein
MQLCALLSQLHRHQEALYHGQIAVRISHFLLRDLKSFIKSLVYREHYSKLEKENKEVNKNNISDLKQSSSRIELKSNRSPEEMKKLLNTPSLKDMNLKREGDNVKKGDKVYDEHDPQNMKTDEQDSMDSADNEVETMSILVKGYKKIYPLIEFLEKFLV